MSNTTPWRHQPNVIASALGALVVFELIVLYSGLEDGLRFGLAGVIAVVFVLTLAMISINRQQR